MHSYTATCREFVSSMRQRPFRHTDLRCGRWLKFHSRKTLITAPQGSQCQCRFVFDTRSITSQVIKRMVLYPSLFHIVTSQEICIKSATVLSEQRLSLNRPSYRISPKIAPVLASFPGNCIGQES